MEGKVQIEHQWIKDTDFKGGKLLGTIADLSVEKNSRGKEDKVLVIQLENGEYRSISVWGVNFNVLVYKYGAVPAEWKGKPIEIHQSLQTDGRVFKIVKV